MATNLWRHCPPLSLRCMLTTPRIISSARAVIFLCATPPSSIMAQSNFPVQEFLRPRASTQPTISTWSPVHTAGLFSVSTKLPPTITIRSLPFASTRSRCRDSAIPPTALCSSPRIRAAWCATLSIVPSAAANYPTLGSATLSTRLLSTPLLLPLLSATRFTTSVFQYTSTIHLLSTIPWFRMPCRGLPTATLSTVPVTTSFSFPAHGQTATLFFTIPSQLYPTFTIQSSTISVPVSCPTRWRALRCSRATPLSRSPIQPSWGRTALSPCLCICSPTATLSSTTLCSKTNFPVHFSTASLTTPLPTSPSTSPMLMDATASSTTTFSSFGRATTATAS